MSREALLEEFVPRGAVCAEIGVQRGNFSQEILEIAQPRLLYLIDAWKAFEFKEGDWYPYKDRAHFQKVQMAITIKRFRIEIKQGIVRVVWGISPDVSDLFEDSELDFCYIDACHNTDAVYADMCAWSKKVKSGGILAGHDYHHQGPRGISGVPKAVNRYVKENKLELHLTDDKARIFHNEPWNSKTWWFYQP